VSVEIDIESRESESESDFFGAKTLFCLQQALSQKSAAWVNLKE